jgi:hypothetical protein
MALLYRETAHTRVTVRRVPRRRMNRSAGVDLARLATRRTRLTIHLMHAIALQEMR